MKNVHKLTEGAILLAAYTVMLLITIYVPILGAFVNLFLSLPFIMFAAKHNRQSSLVFIVAATFLSLIVGTLLAIPLTLAYGLTGLVMGDFVRNQKGRAAVFLAGTITFLLNLVAQYAVAVAFFKIDIIEQSVDLVRESVDQSMSILSALGQEQNAVLLEQLNAGIELLQSLVPSLFVMISLGTVFLIQLVSFPIIKRFGVNIGEWRSFRELTLPKSLLYYFLFALVASLFLQTDAGGYIHIALTNILFVLQLLMVIQGLAFIWYFSHLKEWPKALPVIVTVLVFIMPFLLYIVWILGIIDLGFDLRKRMIK
ncbi:YybS family protein [Bacillus tuaregi]|uniref:YybS family protein n=1 Tax=Bacillus tuaregi TaxID=1816695 RepID=UPI0008F8A3BB|nr:YybS family protein [Bacillus tuaregi]